MKLLVAFLATPGGEDAVALGVCLARTLNASLDISLVIPPDRPEAFASTGS
ncbi:universal stress protein, partial [Streptomyces sp. SID10244]|nr:universal stress protein [Streptomyces sp. SID10244]